MHESITEWNWRDGYFNAAENLVYDLLNREELERSEPRRALDGVHRPLLFCFRHYLKVSLKHQIER